MKISIFCISYAFQAQNITGISDLQDTRKFKSMFNSNNNKKNMKQGTYSLLSINHELTLIGSIIILLFCPQPSIFFFETVTETIKQQEITNNSYILICSKYD